MTDIEQKALALVREVLAERNLSGKRAVRREVSPYTEALCRAIERHEAFRQEVSDVVEQALSFGDVESLRRKGVLSRFIIPKPKPDPLAQTLGDFDGTLWEPEDVLRFRAALEARGLEIREKGQ
jgi:hypothetical protein